MKVVVTGASGFVGPEIVRLLVEGGHDVHVLTRNVARSAVVLGSSCQYHYWGDFSQLPPKEALDGAHGVINLAGAGVADKNWDPERKREIYNSRIDLTRSLCCAIAEHGSEVKAVVSTSAVGIYGSRDSEMIDEEAELGEGFLANVCKDWEEAINQIAHQKRVSIVRVGIVLGPDGGALSKMLLPFKLGIGGKLGNGKQFMSWIHRTDLARLYVEALTNDSYKGIYNGTAPTPIENAKFTKVLGRVLGRPTLFPVPAPALEVMFGEMSEILLEGQRVMPERSKREGFQFKYHNLQEALQEILHR